MQQFLDLQSSKLSTEKAEKVYKTYKRRHAERQIGIFFFEHNVSNPFDTQNMANFDVGGRMVLRKVRSDLPAGKNNFELEISL